MSVYESILSPGGPTLRTLPIPDRLIGSTYKGARRSFDKAIVCGYIRGGKIELLPRDEEVRFSCLTVLYCLILHSSSKEIRAYVD